MGADARFRFVLTASVALLPLAGCGGGGGGSSPAAAVGAPAAPPAPPPYVPTAEDTGTPQLALINATGAFGRGYFGNGVTVAVFDTGLFASHGELSGRVTTGYDAFSNGGSTTSDWNNHGTAVAGVIAAGRNGVAPEGVAPQSILLPVRIADSSGDVSITDAQEAAAINFVRSIGVRISNYSLNDPVNTVSSLGPGAAAAVSAAMPNTLPAWTSYVTAGGVVVVAAGNEGKSEPGLFGELPLLFPSLTPGWLTVASVGAGGTISSFSSKCGPTAAFCLVAPGEGVLTLFTSSSTALANASGTSFSAAVVSGALAVLVSAFPNLTTQQAAQILLQTANKAGIYTDTAIYGQGLLDLEKATRPIGTMSVSTAGQSFDAQATVLTLSGPFGNGVQGALADASFTARDSYGRGYFIPVVSRIRPPSDDFLISNRLTLFGRDELVVGGGGAVYRFGQTAEDGRPSHGSQSAYWVQAELPLGQGWQMAVALNGGPDPGFGPGAQTRRALDRNLLKPTLIADPYLALMEGATSAAVGMPTALGLVSVRFATGAPYDPTRTFNLVTHTPETRPPGRMMAASVALDSPVGERLSAQVGVGTLVEEQTLLGAIGTGATQFGRATTTYASLGGNVALGPRWDVAVAFHAGVTRGDGAEASLVRGVSSVVSTSMGIGLSGRDLVRAGDRFALGLSQPLRVVAGEAVLSLPYGVDSLGRLGQRDITAGLAADGRELDLQGSYALTLGSRSNLAMGVLYRQDPGNRAAAEDDIIGALRWDFRL